jgi:hypothetical protein
VAIALIFAGPRADGQNKHIALQKMHSSSTGAMQVSPLVLPREELTSSAGDGQPTVREGQDACGVEGS